MTCLDSLKRISLLESAFGPMPFGLPDGLTQGPSGLAAALANLSPRQAKAAGLLTSGIYGHIGTTSFDGPSQKLSQSLVSKLRPRMASLGSPLYALTWKQRATPSGPPIFALRASVRRTSDSGCTGWATPATRDYRHANAVPWSERGGGLKGEQLNNQVVHLLGQPVTGSPASTGKRAQLNPAHPRWLMGLPPEWCACAVTATASSPPSPKNSSPLT